MLEQAHRTACALALLPSLATGQGELTANEPGPAYPFGRAHPDAPGELQQFAFMIGECDCVDEIRQADGTWETTDAIWNASYFLNGWGIQDVYWNERFATSNVRLFDPQRGRWFVNYFSMPAASVGAGQWSGNEVVEEGERRMVLWSGSPDGRDGSRLTFYDISTAGFRWMSESVRAGNASATWRSSCERRRAGAAGRSPAFMGHDSSPAHPFGRAHPGAPAPFGDWDFLVGEFTLAVDPDGADLDSATVRGLQSARYFLNGWAIQGRTYLPDSFSSSFHLFDPARGVWRTSVLRMPDYSWTLWDGAYDEAAREILLRAVGPDGQPSTPPRTLRYTAIEPSGYQLYLEEREGDMIRIAAGTGAQRVR